MLDALAASSIHQGCPRLLLVQTRRWTPLPGNKFADHRSVPAVQAASSRRYLIPVPKRLVLGGCLRRPGRCPGPGALGEQGTRNPAAAPTARLGRRRAGCRRTGGCRSPATTAAATRARTRTASRARTTEPRPGRGRSRLSRPGDNVPGRVLVSLLAVQHSRAHPPGEPGQARRPLRGRPGGRAWPGASAPAGVLSPAGCAARRDTPTSGTARTK